MALNAMNPSRFSELSEDILFGRWENVVSTCSTLHLSNTLLGLLYGEIIADLMKADDWFAAEKLLLAAESDELGQGVRVSRAAVLTSMLSEEVFEYGSWWGQGGYRQARKDIVVALGKEVDQVSSGKLGEIIGEAMRWRRLQGRLPEGVGIDLMTGAGVHRHEGTGMVSEKGAVIKMGKKTFIDSAGFSPCGRYLASGSSDGFIEIWDFGSGVLRADLPYQGAGQFMVHEAAVLCLSWSDDGDYLVSGAGNGEVKIWKVETGQCLKTIRAHSQGVCSAQFVPRESNLRIITTSFAGAEGVRVHGLRSGKVVAEFRGFDAYVRSLIVYDDATRMITGDSDGVVRVWNFKTSEKIAEYSGDSRMNSSPSVSQLLWVSRTTFAMASQSPDIKVFSTTRSQPCELDRTISLPEEMRGGKEFVGIALSPKREFMYAIDAEAVLYVFEMETGTLLKAFQVHSKSAVGVVHHPHRSLLAVYAADHSIRMWKARA